MTPAIQSNPWEKLPPAPPFVLMEDAALVSEFNAESSNEHRLRLEILPEPFLGRRDAPVVLLNLNPGFKERDLKHHAAPLFAKRSRENLSHSATAFPFYLISPELEPEIERTPWWDKKLRPLIDHFGDDGRSIVANKVLCVEFFPYHSKKFKQQRRLPSQDYSFGLVRSAIKRGAVILIMRGERRWLEAVPSLATYSRRYTATNVRNPTISPGNFGDGFAIAVEAMRSAPRAW